MDDILEQQEIAQEISQAVSNPISTGYSNDVDEAELEQELEAMEQEELDKELLHIRPVPVATPVTRPGSSATPTSVVDKPSAASVGGANTEKEKKEPTSDLDKELDELASWAASAM
jgi:hypothetical protein